jgi:hypothetical protein
MGRALSNHFLQKLGVFFSAVFLLIACSPKLDWRIVQSPQDGYNALFPGKPEKMDRRISYEGQEIPQSLEAVKIDDDIYSISTVTLSKDQANLSSKILAQLQGNLFGRAGVNAQSDVSADAFYQTTSRQKIATKDYFLEFSSTGASEQSMRVRWINRASVDGGIRIYQISVLHTAPARVDAKKFFSEEMYANFFDEFHPE